MRALDSRTSFFCRSMLGCLWFATPNRGNCKRMANSDNNMAATVDGVGTAKGRGPERDEAQDESSDR